MNFIQITSSCRQPPTTGKLPLLCACWAQWSQQRLQSPGNKLEILRQLEEMQKMVVLCEVQPRGSMSKQIRYNGRCWRKQFGTTSGDASSLPLLEAWVPTMAMRGLFCWVVMGGYGWLYMFYLLCGSKWWKFVLWTEMYLLRVETLWQKLPIQRFT